mmetsp:Transcript_86360/g.171439  ORF Transcript_86360/g.171439 Transcript_86360/m.171439 type:complete len:103 (-) Transcript_86360:28-336(-)
MQPSVCEDGLPSHANQTLMNCEAQENNAPLLATFGSGAMTPWVLINVEDLLDQAALACHLVLEAPLAQLVQAGQRQLVLEAVPWEAMTWKALASGVPTLMPV